MTVLKPRMTAREFSDWLKTLNPDERRSAQRLYRAATHPDTAMCVALPASLNVPLPVTPELLHTIYTLITSGK